MRPDITGDKLKWLEATVNGAPAPFRFDSD
jgi:hypothetical protein